MNLLRTVIFFGEESQVITQIEERGIKFLGVKSSADFQKILDKPEEARQERALVFLSANA